MKYFVYEDANYDSRMFRFLDQKSINEVVKIIKKHGSDGTKANLKSFTKKGHKLLMYHGWSDPAFSPFVSVNYFNSVQQILGSGSATTDNVRLFMVPRMHHCQGFGPGPNTFDELTPLIQWVEQCVAPEGIIASHYINDNPNRPIDCTMPLCSYPKITQYNGAGPVDDASSWSGPTTVGSTSLSKSSRLR
jgi:tannase/feruloyl esterase